VIRRFWAWWRKAFAVVVVAVAFVWSVVAIYMTHRQEAPPDAKVVLRIAHWQLETGVREALDELAADYHKLHPEVTIVQEAIPGDNGTWLTTQLVGGSPPDLVQPGRLSDPVLLGFYQRYFLPLTLYVNQPNPYNANTPLAGVPWRKTFRDALLDGYVKELQAFMRVPLTRFNLRVFYNKTLFQKLTGQAEPPSDFRAFLAVCQEIRRHRDEHGQPYIPIASCRAHLHWWDFGMAAPLTYPALRELDFNRDTLVGMDEFYVGLRTGRIRFDDPPFAARFKVLELLFPHFQAGWTGVTRDDAVFLFAQQRAVFIVSGTWDAGGLQEQAAGEFELGTMPFPQPSKSDPDVGHAVEGPVYGQSWNGFRLAITRACRHPEVALDFLQFLSSQPGNEKLNRIIGWIPAITGAQMRPEVQSFDPIVEGVLGTMQPALGGDTANKWLQMISLFNIGEISYPAMAAEYLAYYNRRAPEEYAELRRNPQRSLPNDYQFLAGFRAYALTAPAPEAQNWWKRYRMMVGGRLLLRDLNDEYLDALLAEGKASQRPPPYAIRPSALAAVRDRLAREQGGR
jgi:raffinose/stachyose/melibiose transport system substrate-binding protein